MAGILLPLFAARTARSMGIGDIGDLDALAKWSLEAGHKLLQLLPLGDLPDGENSPYAAATSFGIDPMYVAVDRLEDLRAEDRVALLGPDGEAGLERLRSSAHVDYPKVRTLKRRFLRAAFDRFHAREWSTQSARAQRMARFMEHERSWLDDYALFWALKQRFGQSWWLAWPKAIRDREPQAVEEHGRELHASVLHNVYVQWIAHEQWAEARRTVNGMGVELMGDLPFMVGIDSADVWGRRHDFLTEATIGVPGDAMAPDGQDWGLPSYDWASMKKHGLEWVRRRSEAMGKFFDRFRIDHAIGYYRMYVRPRDGSPPHWVPSDEKEQITHGEEVLTALIESARKVGARIVAEDLGTVPTFMPPSLAKLSLPGYKVMMWEKDGDVFRDPARYPYLSLATMGTHDTITMATWWESMPFDERRHAIADIPALREIARDKDVDKLTPHVHAALLDAIHGAGSELVLLSMQDLLGEKDRVNVPGVAGENNWTYRLPDTLENMRVNPQTAECMRVARENAQKHGR